MQEENLTLIPQWGNLRMQTVTLIYKLETKLDSGCCCSISYQVQVLALFQCGYSWYFLRRRTSKSHPILFSALDRLYENAVDSRFGKNCSQRR